VSVMPSDAGASFIARRDVMIAPFGRPGTLQLPEGTKALVVFAHGSGSSRLSPRNRQVADALNAKGIGTFLFDLLTPVEERDRRNVFDIPFLAERLAVTVRWLDRDENIRRLTLGLFGASTGAAAALVAATQLGNRVKAVVSRGGRPDLAIEALLELRVPTLLIVGGDDTPVIALNQSAFDKLGGPKSLMIVPGASHLFSEPGAMEQVIALAAEWFADYLCTRASG